MSLVQSLNTTAARHGNLNTLRGLASMMTPSGAQAAELTGMSGRVTDLFEGFGQSLSKVAAETRLGAPSIRDTETLIRGMTWHASVGDQLKRLGYATVSDAPPNIQAEIIAQGIRDSYDANHLFGAMGKPAWFNRASKSGSSLLTQFFSFPFKQSEVIMDTFLDNPGNFGNYLLTAGAFSKFAADLQIDLDDYVGVGYMNDPFHRGSDLVPASMPVQTLLAMVMAVDGEFNSAVSPSEQEKRILAAKDAATNLIPFFTASGRLDKTTKALVGEEVEIMTKSARPDLRVRANLGIEPDATGRPSDLPAILLQMRSVAQKQDELVWKKTKDLEHKKEQEMLDLTNEFYRAAVEGRDPDIELVREYSTALQELGFPLRPEQLLEIKKDVQHSIDLTESVRRRLMDKRLGAAADKEMRALRGQGPVTDERETD